jgi:hypothetical protein
MARANQHFTLGHNWHLTHRCHKRDFLLKWSKDRNRWIGLIFKAKKRYHLPIFYFIVTGNHIHLIVSDSTQTVAIPQRFNSLRADRDGNTPGEKIEKALFGKIVIILQRLNPVTICGDAWFMSIGIWSEPAL